MKISYTKTIELTDEQALVEANEYLEKHGCKHKFEVVKCKDNQLIIYIYVKRIYADDPNVPIYHIDIALNKEQFEERISRFLTEIYSEK